MSIFNKQTKEERKREKEIDKEIEKMQKEYSGIHIMTDKEYKEYLKRKDTKRVVITDGWDY